MSDSETSDKRTEVDELTKRIADFGPNEIIGFPRQIPELGNLSAESFLQMFDDQPKLYQTKYFVDQLKEEIFTTQFEKITSIDKFIQKQKEQTEEIRDVLKRSNMDPHKVSGNIRQICGYMEKITEYIYYCDMYMMHLKENSTVSLPLKYFEEFLKRSYIYQNITFPLRFLKKLVQRYPVIRRNVILSYVEEKITSSLSYPNCLPTPPNSKEELYQKLEKYCKLSGVKFDINAHDGQEFLYNCEKAFKDSFKDELEGFEYKEETITPSPNDLVALINSAFIDVSICDKFLTDTVIRVLTCDYDLSAKAYIEDSYKLIMNRKINRNHVVCFFKLRLVVIKKMFIQLLHILDQILTIKSNFVHIEKTEERNKMLCSIIYQLIATESQIILMNFGEIDHEAIIQDVLGLEVEFQKQKLTLLQSLMYISKHSNNPCIEQMILKFANRRPDLILGFTKSIRAPFNLAIDTLRMINEAVTKLISWQLIVQNKHCESFPAIYPVMSKIVKLLFIIPDIAYEFCESYTVSPHVFSRYFEYAIWKQIDSEINKCFFMVDNVPIMSPYIDDWNFVSKFIKQQQESRQERLLSTFWKFHHLGHILNLILLLQREYNAEPAKVPPFDLNDMNDYLIIGDLASMKDIIIKQNRYLSVIDAAARFNSFANDAEFINRNYYMTKTSLGAFQLFSETPKFSSLPTCAISAISLDDPQQVFDFIAPFAYKYEIAHICQIERLFFVFNPAKKVFSVDQLEKKEKIDPTIIPTVYQCLYLEDELRETLELMHHRIAICYLSRFESVISMQSTPAFMELYNNKLWWESSRLESLKFTKDFKSFHEMFIKRFNLALLLSIYAYNNRLEIEDSSKSEPIKLFWKMVRNCDKPTTKQVNVNRYRPPWLQFFMIEIHDDIRMEISNSFAEVDSLELPIEMKARETLLVFALILLKQNVLFSDLTLESVVEKVSHSFELDTQITDKSTEEQIEIIIEEQRPEVIKRYNEQIHEMLEKVFMSPNAVLKPECYTKRIKKNQLYLSSPSESCRQFNAEYSHMKALFVQKLISLAQDYDEEDAMKISNMLYSIAPIVSKRLCLNWSGYMNNKLGEVRTWSEVIEFLPTFKRIMFETCESKTRSIYFMKQMNQFLVLNHTQNISNRQKEDAKTQCDKIEQGIRKEYAQLLSDLNVAIKANKAKFARYHRNLFASTTSMVKRHIEIIDPTVESESRLPTPKTARGDEYMINDIEYRDISVQTDPIQPVKPLNPTSSSSSFQFPVLKSYIDTSKIDRTNKEIEEIKKQILLNRCVRVIVDIGKTKYFKYRKEILQRETKQLNIILFHGKHDYDEKVEKFTNKISSYSEQMRNLEGEIEELKVKLEKRRQKVAKLVHERSMTLTYVEQLTNKLKQFRDVEAEEDVQALCAKIEEAHDELDRLTEETDNFENVVQLIVREPMKEIDSARKRITEITRKRVELMQNSQNSLFATDDSEKIMKTINENELLSQENDELKKKIKEFEEKKNHIDPIVMASIEELTVSKEVNTPRPMIDIYDHPIVKPAITPRMTVPRNFVRASIT